MKSAEYIEGPKAQGNFEEGMRAIFKVPKDEVVAVEKKAKKKRASRRASLRRSTTSDKG